MSGVALGVLMPCWAPHMVSSLLALYPLHGYSMLQIRREAAQKIKLNRLQRMTWA